MRRTLRRKCWLALVAPLACQTGEAAPREASPSSPPIDKAGESAAVSRWPAAAPLELYKPNPDYAMSLDLLEGQSELVGKVVNERPLFHDYRKGCATKSYGVRRKGDDEKGLFFVTFDTCGNKVVRDLSRLVVGKTYRFLLGPRIQDDQLILDAIAVGGPPFPPCTKTPLRSLDLEGLSLEEVQIRFGLPHRRDEYQVGERKGRFYRPLQRAYPSNVPDNEYVRIDEWTWRVDDCALTVWFHHPKDQWQVLEDFYHHMDEKF